MQSEKDGEDENFKKRVDSIFGHLDDIQKKHENVVIDYEKCVYPLKYNIQFQSEDRFDIAPNKNKDSAKRKLPKQVPDHVLNPQKWKKYSLEEDGSNVPYGLSPDDLNRQVALGFLESLKKRKSDCQLEKDTNQINPVFTKPSERKDFATQKDPSGSVHNGLSHVMNTFEFGEISSNSKQLPKPNHLNSSTVNKIDLSFNEDEEDEDDSSDKKDVLSVDPIIFKKTITNKKFRKRTVDDNLDES
ncbi:U5 small nuclear ribonucleoprotein TSSC4 isoform X1 [Hydra vulgaris]|uniref:U5 small nuclear ribonucleoprotein TSSC4 isoform X1 n=1 Tax=Hydra vulgaris TaxID=6087 RepID=UPI001F5EE6C0|nr:protein TSSC4 [Hydra vulgaris]